MDVEIAEMNVLYPIKLQVGIDNYIPKPYQRDGLIESIYGEVKK